VIEIAASGQTNEMMRAHWLRSWTVLLLVSACSAGEVDPSGSGGGAGTAAGGVSGAGSGGTGGSAAAAGASGGSSVAGSSAGAGTTGAAGASGGGPAGGAGTTGAAGTTGVGGSTGMGGTTGAGGRGGASGVGGGNAGVVGTAGAVGRGGSGGTTGAGGRGGTAGTGSAGTGSSGSTGAGGSPAATTPIGFASLNGGTTGGRGAQVVTVTTFADLRMYAESATAYTIMVQGTISNGANGGQVRVKSNKSIIGVGSTAYLFGVGIDINNANNIIIQNLRMSMTGVTTRTDTAGVYTSSGDDGLPQILVNGGDTISIQGTSKNIWIDHCELFTENPDTQTNKDLYDGLIDIKGQTGFITISYCYLHDHHKGGLVGASDTDVFADRKITFHHNHYNKVKLRIPMYRGAVGHFFNNYIVGAQDASEIRANTCIRIERNYYEPLHYSIYTSSDSMGNAQVIENVEVMKTARAYPPSCTADIPYNYSGVLISNANDVKTRIPPLAGVGKI
jgi:pectate lyase